jgi:hypothetical protein
MDGHYDTMQVCLNGHKINASYWKFEAHNRAFCPTCGDPTITACPSCEGQIKGQFYIKSVGRPVALGSVRLPSFCHACGVAYPWHVSKIAAAIENLGVEGLPEADVQEIERNLPDITRDTPRSQVAAARVRGLLGKAGKPIYDVAIKIISDIASASAKSHLGL